MGPLLPRSEHTLSAPRCNTGHRPNPSTWCGDILPRRWNSGGALLGPRGLDGFGVVQVGAQRSESDSWLVGERAVSAGSVGNVEREC